MVEAIPSAKSLAVFHSSFPNAMLRILVHEGQKLAHLHYQDSCSFEIAELFLGAKSQAALLEKYRALLMLLLFQIRRGALALKKNGHE